MIRSLRGALALACALMLPAFAWAATIPATPANVWTQIHDVAQPGDTVALGSGTYDLSMWNVVKAAPGITVTPAAGAQVVATVIAVNGSSNVTYKGITVQMLPATQYGVDAEGASTTNITFDGLKVQGADCAQLGGVGAWFRSLGQGANIVLKNSTFKCLGAAVGGLDLDGLTIDGNDLQAIQTDGIILTGVTHVVVRNNTASNFHTAGGGHPDFIQFANSAEGPSAHVVITGNHYERAAGDPAQGVFVEDGSDFTITGNVLQGTMYNGVSLARTKSAVISNNFLQAYPDMTTWIMARQEADGITITNNAAPSVIVGVGGEPQPTNVKQSSNMSTAPAAAGDETQMLAWQTAQGAAVAPLPAPAPGPTPVPAVDPLQPALDAATAQIAALKAKITKAQAALLAYPSNTAKQLQNKIANALAALK